MEKRQYYTNVEKDVFKKNKKIYFIILGISLIALIAFNTVILVISQYETRTLFKAILSVVNVLFALFITLNLSIFIFPNRAMLKHFHDMQEGNKQIIKGKIIEIKAKIYSHNSNLSSYEIIVEDDSTQTVFYLLSIFEMPKEFVNKNVIIESRNSFIKEIKTNE